VDSNGAATATPDVPQDALLANPSGPQACTSSPGPAMGPTAQYQQVCPAIMAFAVR
jgi:hypothetical protein